MEVKPSSNQNYNHMLYLSHKLNAKIIEKKITYFDRSWSDHFLFTSARGLISPRIWYRCDKFSVLQIPFRFVYLEKGKEIVSKISKDTKI